MKSATRRRVGNRRERGFDRSRREKGKREKEESGSKPDDKSPEINRRRRRTKVGASYGFDALTYREDARLIGRAYEERVNWREREVARHEARGQ